MPYNKKLCDGKQKRVEINIRGTCKELINTHDMILTPVAAVPVNAQARGSRYQGAFEIKNIPNA